MLTPLVRKATGNQIIKSTFLEKCLVCCPGDQLGAISQSSTCLERRSPAFCFVFAFAKVRVESAKFF